ncbi:MAG TPA: HTTM domain-containing protein [Pseudobdellovibrionaceae bacterium]|jgi:hypothetical protein
MMTSAIEQIRLRFTEFMLKPASATPLAILRITVGFTLLLQAFMVSSIIFKIFSSSGYIQGELAQALNNPYLPQIAHLQYLLSPFGANETFCILLVCFSYVIGLFLLIAGWQTRLMSFLVWLLHWILMNSAQSTNYGVDHYAHIFLFYFIWVPCGSAWSIDAWKKGDLNPPSSTARIGLRVLQLHLCISYLMSGIEKAQGIQWWNGELLWRALTLPVYRQFDMSWLAYWPRLSMIAGWGSLFLELGYCVLIWPKLTRKIWVAGIIGMHLGIFIFLGLHLFGLFMIFLTACLFGLSAEDSLLIDRVSSK